MDLSHVSRASAGATFDVNSPAVRVPDTQYSVVDSENGTRLLNTAGPARDRSSASGMLALSVFFLALLFAGIHFGHSDLLVRSSQYLLQLLPIDSRTTSTDEGVDQARGGDPPTASATRRNAHTLRSMEENEDRIAFLKRTVQSTKKLLSDVSERCSVLESERDIVYKAATKLQTAEEKLKETEERPVGFAASKDDVRLLRGVINSIKAALGKKSGKQALVELVEDQKAVLASELELAARREMQSQIKMREAQKLGKEISAMQETLASLTTKLADTAEKLRLHQKLEREIDDLVTMLEVLKRTRAMLNNGSAYVSWHGELKEVVQRIGVLAGNMRRKQEGQMMYISHMSTVTAAQVQMLIENFAISLKRGVSSRTDIMTPFQDAVTRKYNHFLSILGKVIAVVCTLLVAKKELPSIHHAHALAFLRIGRFFPVTCMLQDERTPDWEANEFFVGSSLGVSKRLNDRMLAWETAQARKISQLEEMHVTKIEQSIETKEDIGYLERAVKDIVREARGSQAFENQLSYLNSRASALIRQVVPKGDALQFLVERFRPVNAADESEGKEVMFEFIDALRKGPEGLVVKVRPVDADLEEELGDLAMKIYTLRAGDSLAETEATLLKRRSLFDIERNALRIIAFQGESIADVGRRTGINAVHYIGSVTGWSNGDVERGGFEIPTGDVAFMPLTAMVLDSLYFEGERNPLSMMSRIYMAQRLLWSVAYIHSAGYVHNSISLSKVGITEDGCAVLLDCGSMGKAGSERPMGSLYSAPPETVLEFWEKGAIVGNYVTDSWGVGVTLYMVFTGGIRPFLHSDSDFFEGSVHARRIVQMQNIESPCLLLHRIGVPDMWINAISLLLERNASIRPSVLQVLQAYPGLLSWPFESLQDVEETY